MLPYPSSYFIDGAASAIISERFTARFQDFILAFITYRAPRDCEMEGKEEEAGEDQELLWIKRRRFANRYHQVPYACIDDGKCARE